MLQENQEAFENAIKVREDIDCGKTNHQQSGSLKPALPPHIISVSRLVMRRSIDLDHESAFEAGKIRDERPEWYLAAKLESAQTAFPDRLPQLDFRQCQADAEGFCL